MSNLCSRLSSFITAMATTAANTDEHHDVFLSFCGDTRYNFTSHLLGAIKRHHVNTYVDSFDLERGSEISSTLVSAIGRAQVAVIVLSEHTASSKWCLEEVAEIMDCKRRRNQIVLPVFYHVDPSDVRHQSGCYGVAFEEHMRKECIHKVRAWREALREVANLSGWHCVPNMNNEHELVESIAEDVRKKVQNNCLNVNKARKEFERQKVMLRELYKINKITPEQILHVLEMAKIANLAKDIGKASKLSEEIKKKVIEEEKKKVER